METLDALMPSNAVERRTLADIIFAKIDSAEAGNAAVIQKVQQGASLNHQNQGQTLTAIFRP